MQTSSDKNRPAVRRDNLPKHLKQAQPLKEGRMREGRILTRGVPRWRRLLAAPFFYVGIRILGGQVWLEELNDAPEQNKPNQIGKQRP